MNITLTEISDTNLFDGSIGSRLYLMDEIIANFTPLVNEEIERKQRQYEENLKDLTKLKKEVSENQTGLKKYDQAIKLQNTKAEVLEKIEYLYNSNVLYGQNKQKVKEILSQISNIHSGPNLEAFKKQLDRMIKLNVKKMKEG